MSTNNTGHQRLVLVAVLLAVAGLLGFGYYLQYVEYLDPCPLCMTQRFFYYLIAFTAMLALFAVRRVLWQKTMAIFMLLASVGGIVTAGRHVWLQQLPPELVPECGPGLEYWLDNMPYLKTLELLFKGDGNCAEVDTVLGVSIAIWSLGAFVLFALTTLWLFICRRRLSA